MKSSAFILAFYLCLPTALHSQLSWQQITTPGGSVIKSFAVATSGTILAVATERIYRSTDNGIAWSDVTPSDSGFHTPHVLIALSNRSILLGASATYCSSNDGLAWSPIVTNRALSDKIEQNPLNGDMIDFAVPFGWLSRSQDNGQTWQDVGPDNIYASEYYAFCIDSSGVYFRGTSLGVYRSIDNAGSWIQKNLGLAGALVQVLDARSSTAIFAGTTNAGIYFSTNLGDSWTTANTGLDIADIRSFAGTSDGQLFVATNGSGVFRSFNKGELWTKANDGLPELFVRKLHTASQGYVFAATSGEHIFRTQQSVMSVAVQDGYDPKNFTLSQNFPNPFNPVTRISYALPSEGMVSLHVYDAVGRLVKVLVNDYQAAGHYSVSMDGSHFPSGMYFYRLIFGTQILTKSCVLLK